MKPELLDQISSSRSLLEKLHRAIEAWLAENRKTAPAAAQDLAQVLLASVAGLRLESDQTREDATAGIAVAESILVTNQIAIAVRELFGILQQGTHRSLHPVLTPVVQAELDALGIPGEVLVSSVGELSYELLTLDRDSFKRFADPKELDKVRWPFLVFRVPSPPLDWPLHHVLLFHELGHAHFGPHRETYSYATTPPELLAELSEADTEEKRIRAEFREAVFQQTVRRWTEEAFADLLGVLLVGPAFFFGFCRLLGIHRIDTAGESHPPTSLRILLMSKVLKDLELTGALPEDTAKAVVGWSEYATEALVSTVASPQSSAVFRGLSAFVGRELIANYNALVGFAAGLIAGRTLAKTALPEDMARGVQLLQLSIPPIEKCSVPSLSGAPEPLEPARIFSSCWGAYFAGTAEGMSEVEERKLFENCSEALLHSLDAAECIRSWGKAS